MLRHNKHLASHIPDSHAPGSVMGSLYKITRKHGQYHILKDEALGTPEALAGKLDQRKPGAIISS